MYFIVHAAFVRIKLMMMITSIFRVMVKVAVSGPTIWNTLPSTLRVSITTLGQFQSGLKTMLFCLAYGT